MTFESEQELRRGDRWDALGLVVLLIFTLAFCCL